MSFVTDLFTHVFERRYRPWSRHDADERPIEELADALIQCTGELTELALATKILDRFEVLNDSDKVEFFEHLAQQMDIDALAVERSLAAYRNKPSKKTYHAFSSAVEPARQELFRRLNQVSGATGKLVSMRAELLRLKADSNTLAALDLDFQHLFASWFNRGFLVLRPINWESPAHILEKIIEYEAVHAIDSWDDLRLRLQPTDRRCFAFFHLSMPDEPLIFVEVALNQGIADSIQTILEPDREELASHETDTAVFYSISNCQRGLANISFGNSLIKQVVMDLSAELPNVSTFVTLSPVPGFMRWFKKFENHFEQASATNNQAMAAHYLLHAKDENSKPLDPVARFHLGNGASLHAVHANADTSENGQKLSAGTMVNYMYDLKTVASNHEKFAADGSVISSSEVQALDKKIVHAVPALGKAND